MHCESGSPISSAPEMPCAFTELTLTPWSKRSKVTSATLTCELETKAAFAKGKEEQEGPRALRRPGRTGEFYPVKVNAGPTHERSQATTATRCHYSAPITPGSPHLLTPRAHNCSNYPTHEQQPVASSFELITSPNSSFPPPNTSNSRFLLGLAAAPPESSPAGPPWSLSSMCQQ
eukprot:gene3174-13188_t